MSRLRLLALVAILAGLALVVYGLVEGSVRVGLFLIIPFIYGTGILPGLGMLLLIGGAFLWMLGGFQRVAAAPPVFDETRTTTRSGGVVLLGPIPIVWGSDRRVLPWMVAAGVALLVLALWLTWMRR